MPPTIYIKEYHAPCGELLLGCALSTEASCPQPALCLCDWREVALRRNLPRLSRLLHAEVVSEEAVKTREAAELTHEETELIQMAAELTHEAACQLDEYFAARRQTFTLPLLTVGTAFQRSVWEALQRIPYGRTCAYQDVANAIGRPTAVRAVANAVGSNPLSIFIPCHRVIATGGGIGGYAGGLTAKRWLLKLEQPLQTL